MSSDLNSLLDLQGSEDDELRKAINNLKVHLLESIQMKDEIERNVEKFSSELNLVKEDLAQSTEQNLFTKDMESEILAFLQTEKERKKNLQEEREQTKHPWEITNQQIVTFVVKLLSAIALLYLCCYCIRFVYDTVKVESEEQTNKVELKVLEYLHKMTEENARNSEKLSSELNLMRKLIVEKTEQLLQVKNMVTKLSANFQTEKEEKENFQEVLGQEEITYQYDISDQQNVTIAKITFSVFCGFVVSMLCQRIFFLNRNVDLTVQINKVKYPTPTNDLKQEQPRGIQFRWFRWWNK